MIIDVTPRGELGIIIRSLLSAVFIVLMIALFKMAIDAFLSVAFLILPIALVIYLFQKFNGAR